MLSTFRFLGRIWQVELTQKDCEGRVWVKARCEGRVLWILESYLSGERVVVRG